jgi:hypothetical protein
MAGEPGWVNAYPNFLAMQQQQQEKNIQAWQFQQTQQQARQQAAAQQAAGNALPQLLQGGQVAAQPTQGQMPPPPQPPAPGQASTPMQPPPSGPAGGGIPPLPQGPQPGQVNRPPIPPGGVPQGAAGAMPPPGVPPFKPMPTTPPPQQAAAPAAITPPPAQAPQQQAQQPPADDQMEGGFSLQRIVQSGQKQGLTGSDLWAYVNTFEPYMTAQQKAKAEQVKNQIEIKKLDAEIQAHQIAASNQQLSLQERIKHDDALERLASRRADIQQENVDVRKGNAGGGGAPSAPAPDITPNAQGELPPPKAIGGFSSQAIQALADDYATRGPTALAGFGYKNLPPAARAEIVNYAAAKNNQTGGNFASNKIQYAADTAGARVNAQQAAKTDAAANALTSTGGIGDQFQKAIDDLGRTGLPIANQAQMQALRLTNDPRVSTYDTAVNGVVSEAAQILGRGTITVNSMEEARKVVEGWHTSAQARAGLAQLKREASTTVKASSEEVAKSAGTAKGQPGINGAPKVGTVEGGYRFKGGDPAQQSSWEKQ